MDEPVLSAEAQVQARAAVAFRLAGLYQEEGNGLLWALSSAKPLEWSKDPERQARFLVGFNEGCEILRVAGRGASPTEAVGEGRTEC